MTGSILVVGAGIAGRAVALALAQHGLGCTVVERRKPVGRGMGLNLPGNAVRALADLMGMYRCSDQRQAGIRTATR